MPAPGPDPVPVPDIEQLRDEAIALRRLQHERPADGTLRARIDRWRATSPRHETQWRLAERYWRAAGEVQPRRESALNRFRCALELEFERVAEAYRGRALVAAAPVLALGLMLALGFLLLRPQTPASPASDIAMLERPAELDYRSPARGTRELTLSDGSVLALNWDTELSVRMSREKREITLRRGEARFRVSKDADRPFVVRVGDSSATALGTSYSVHRIAGDEANIVVEEGIVEVRAPDGGTRRLLRDQRIRIGSATLGEIEDVDAAMALAWTEGLLIFSKRPLIEALEELGRYTSLPLDLDGLDGQAREVTATYFTARADDALQLIADGFDLQLRRTGNGTIVVSPAGPATRR